MPAVDMARGSLRRVEAFCANRYIHLESDDWWGPVRWADSDGTTGSLEGEEVAAAAMGQLAQLNWDQRLRHRGEPLRAGTDPRFNPDAAFLLAVRDARPGWPDAEMALEAHRIINACYRSAALSGAPMTLDADGGRPEESSGLTPPRGDHST